MFSGLMRKIIMTVTTIDLYNILKGKIGENEARTLVEFVEIQVEKKFEE